MSDNNPKPQHKILWQQSFSGLNHLCQYIQDTDSIMPETSRISKAKTPEYTTWTGTDSLETSIELAHFGWGDGLKKIRKLVKEVKVSFPDIFPRQENSEEIIRSEVGHYEDPSLEDSPDPMSMLKFKPKFDELKYGSVLQRIIIESGCSGGISPETIFLRGACVCALIEQLEMYGFRVEVIMQSTGNAFNTGDTKPGELCVINTTIKRFEDHLDIDAIAFSVANPSFERRLMFAVLETMPGDLIEKFSIGNRYGYPHNQPIYTDPLRDFYMVRPLSNQTFQQMIDQTVALINNRYKGLVDDSYNPELGGDNTGGGFKYPGQN